MSPVTAPAGQWSHPLFEDAAGVSAVSARMRRTVEWVRSRVEPPAP